jgi:adenylylsulfate reductase subunit A
MQAIMDEYAGGIGQNYRYNAASLAVAAKEIRRIERDSDRLRADDMRGLTYIMELSERLTLCKSVIAHLSARKETRWNTFAEHTDYPGKSTEFECYINSVLEDGEIKIVRRELVGI